MKKTKEQKTREQKFLDLTEKQRNILLFIKKYHKENDFYPSIREMAENFGINIASVRQHLLAAEKKGFIVRRQQARTIKFLKEI